MKEERLIYLEEHPTKANGFYRRSLATRFGTIEDLSVPRVREGNFRPSCLPPYRRRSLDLEEVIIAMYRGGLSTRDISKFLENLYGTRYSPAGISRLYLCPRGGDRGLEKKTLEAVLPCPLHRCHLSSGKKRKGRKRVLLHCPGDR